MSVSAATETSIKGIDWKRHLWLLGLTIPTLPFAAAGLVTLTGWSAFWLWGPLFLYVLVPILEYFIGTDPDNPPESKVPALEADPYYRWTLYAYIPIQYAALLFCCWVVATWGLAWWEVLLFAGTMGIVSGTGINTAHELGHKKDDLERWLSKITLAPVAYGHFYVEHNKGHHRRVATPEDPASARIGESFWAFLPRTVIGSLRSAWDLERTRLGRKGKSPWTLENEVIQTHAMTVVLFAVLAVVFGWAALAFLIIQAAYGASLLENVNYLEHYGLLREKQADGRYERVRPAHSWNSNHLMTNLLLYHLQRHSDHHAYPTRRYQALRHYEDVPQLPSGYASLIPVSYIPPIWRRLMDHRVAEVLGHDMTRANIQPGKEDEIFAKWHRPAETAAIA